MIIPAISLWQPWASAMDAGWKKNETRHWSTGYRGYLAIHAAKKKYNPNEYEPEFAHAMRNKFNFWPDNMPYGMILCVVRLVGCEPTEKIRDLVSDEEKFWGNYEDKRFAWITSPLNKVNLAAPIPCRGHQGLFHWEVPEDLKGRLVK